MMNTRDDHRTPVTDRAKAAGHHLDRPDAVVFDLDAYRARVDTRDVMSVRELAAYLSLGLNTTYENLRSGVIPGTRVGRRWIVSRKRISAWLEAGAPEGGS
jgi:excisionase family DNA binding protein